MTDARRSADSGGGLSARTHGYGTKTRKDRGASRQESIQALLAFVSLGVIALGIVAELALVRDRADFVASALIGGLLALTACVGGVIVVRRSGHLVGWILIAIALVVIAATVTQNYAATALLHGDPLPGAHVAAWLSLWIGMPAFGLFVFLVLLFPTGNLPSPRWRIVAFAAVVGTVTMVVATAFKPGPMPAIPSHDNPLALRGASTVLALLEGIGSPIVALASIAAVASQIVRLRRSRGEEAQQIKSVAYAMVMVPVLIFVSQLLVPQGASEDQWIEFALNLVAAAAIPVAIGIAILRYRLYDIDVVINRTLVYGTLTAILAAAYFGLVALLQTALAPVTEGSDLAVVASTLAVAALFRPARARIQRFIDRRFYRSRYDATETLEAFAGRVRDEVDLASLRAELLAVVTETMQPSQARLWLRGDATG